MKKEKEKIKYDYVFDIVIGGYKESGKTCLLNSICNSDTGNSFSQDYTPTIKLFCKEKTVTIDDKLICLRVFDLYYDKFKPDKIEYRGFNGAIILYDINNKESFQYAKELYGHISGIILINESILALVGNKIDLSETSSMSSNKNNGLIQDAKEFSNMVGIDLVYEISVKYNINIDSFFMDFVSKIYKNEICKEKLEKQPSEKSRNKSDKCTIN